MAKLTQNLLLKYTDDELSDSQANAVERMLESSPDDARTIEEWERIGSLLRVMDEETTRDVSFDGLADKVLAEVKTTRISLPFFERLKVWLSEFFEHRRAVWIPATAVACAACLAVVVPFFVQNRGANADFNDTNIVLHSALIEEGSQIAAVDFGAATGEKYAVNDGRGNTVGVVWIDER